MGSLGSETGRDAPLWVLRPSTISHLSSQLQSEKIIPTDEGLLRDWRGVAEGAGFAESGGHMFMKIKNAPDHFQEIFNLWKKVPESRVHHLLDVLADLDRFDVLDDTSCQISEDIKVADRTARDKGLELTKLPASQQEQGEEALTYDDLQALNTGKPLPHYDAFILYGFSEESLALEMLVHNLEAQGLSLLVKDRDLLGGSFEHTSVMQLISRRCTKLITVFSNSFFNSEYNTFLANFAQHESLENPGVIRNKIIPLVVEDCQIPANLSLYSKLKYEPGNSLLHKTFWSRLVKSINPAINFDQNIKMVEVPSRFTPPVSNQPSTELSSPVTSISSADTKKLIPDPPVEKEKTATKLSKLFNKSSNKSSDTISKAQTSKKSITENSSLDFTKVEDSSSEFSSLESDNVGDSGALLLPDVPQDDDFLTKIKKKFTPNKKTKYKKQLAQDTSC